jgi:hypothetical protein
MQEFALQFLIVHLDWLSIYRCLSVCVSERGEKLGWHMKKIIKRLDRINSVVVNLISKLFSRLNK